MTISYSTIFGQVGALVARINSYGPLASTTLAADLAALVASFSTTWQPATNPANTYAGFQLQLTNWRRTLARIGDARISDPATVLSLLSAPLPAGTPLSSVIPALMRQFTIDAQTFKASVCAAGTVTAAAGNTGDGHGYVTLTLDGVNPPVIGAAAYLAYNGLTSQMCVPSETITLECVADSADDGLAVGSERWTWTGAPAFGALAWQAEGSGNGPSLVTDSGSGIVSNGDFASFTSNVPAGWTLTHGVAGTSALQDGAEWKLVGDGTTQDTITFALPALTPGRRYHVSLLARMTGATTGTLTVSGFGGSASIACSGLGAAKAPLRFFQTTPAPWVAGSLLTLDVSGLNTGGSVWLSGVAVAPAAYAGGCGVNVTRGATAAWKRGDRLSFTLSNDQAGKFQDYWRRRYAVQLPTSGSPTVNDALVA